MADEKNETGSQNEEEKSKPKELKVGPIEVAVSITVKSPDPGDPPDDGTKAGLRPKKR